MPPEPDPLLAMAPDHPRLLRLARRLLGDPDAAQDAVAHALERAPAGRRSVSRVGFLRTAVRNWASNHRRRERNRRRHELAVEPREPVLPPDELLAREQLRRRVADAVLALDEPYRTTVSLVHLEELPVAEVAQRLGVAEATIRVRLHRAHTQLRAKLDRDYGDRRAWAALVGPAPAALAPGAAAGALFGVLAMKNASLPLLAAALVLAGGGTFWLFAHAGSGDRAGAATTVAAASAPAVSAAVTPSPAQRADELQRDAVAAGPPAATSAPRARVLLADGRPAASLPYWIWPGDLPSCTRVDAHELADPLPAPAGETAADGSLPRPAAPLTVALTDGMLVSWLRPLDVMQMPALATISFALVDAPAVEEWEVTLDPVVPDRTGYRSRQETVLRVAAATGEVLLSERSQSRRVERASTVALPAVAGRYYAPWALGKGLRFDALRPTPAPASVEVHCRQGRTVRVRVLAGEGSGPVATPLAVTWTEGPVGKTERAKTAELRIELGGDDGVGLVAMADDEVFEAQVPASTHGETAVDFVQGRGRKAWFLGARDGEEARELRWQRPGGDWATAEIWPKAGSVCLLDDRSRFCVHGLEPLGTRVLVIAKSGRVLEAHGGAPGRWLPTQSVALPDRALLDNILPPNDRSGWSVQLQLPDCPHETWANVTWLHPAEGDWSSKTRFELPVALTARLVAHTEHGDVAVPWPR